MALDRTVAFRSGPARSCHPALDVSCRASRGSQVSRPLPAGSVPSDDHAANHLSCRAGRVPGARDREICRSHAKIRDRRSARSKSRTMPLVACSRPRPIEPLMSHDTTVARRQVEITNSLGLHLRPAEKFVKLALRYQADVRVYRNGNQFNGKSILDLMT